MKSRKSKGAAAPGGPPCRPRAGAGGPPGRWARSRAPILGTLLACALGGRAALAAPEAPSSGSLGFRLGDNSQRLHPFVDVDTHWVTNPGRRPRATVSDLLSTGRIGFDLTFPSSVFELGGDGGLAYNRYWGVVDRATVGLSSFAGHLALDGVANRDGNLTVRLSEHFVRSADPANQTVTQRLLHNLEQASVAVDVKPGGGALMLTAGYGFFWDRYDRDDNAVLQPGALDNMRHIPEARLTWKFLPKTALFAEGQAQLTRFGAQPLPGSQVFNVDSSMVTAQLGLAGNITRRVTAMLRGGYGNTLVASGADNLQTGVGQVELVFDFTETSRLRLGGQRTIQPTSVFRYYALTRGYVALEQQLAAGTQLRLAPAYHLYDYGAPLVGPPGQRRDQDVVAEASVAQRLSDWITVSAVERFDWRTSNYSTAEGNAGYVFNDVLLRLDVRY